MCYYARMSPNQRTVTVIEAAQDIGVHPQTIRHWLKTGILKGVKPSASQQAQWRIPASEVERIATGGTAYHQTESAEHDANNPLLIHSGPEEEVPATT